MWKTRLGEPKGNASVAKGFAEHFADTSVKVVRMIVVGRFCALRLILGMVAGGNIGTLVDSLRPQSSGDFLSSIGAALLAWLVPALPCISCDSHYVRGSHELCSRLNGWPLRGLSSSILRFAGATGRQLHLSSTTRDIWPFGTNGTLRG